jgi:cyclase
MLSKRIIPCIDVKDGVVVKGVRFKNHEVMGGVVEFAKRYRDEGADELVLYDITASSDGRSVSAKWVAEIARELDIPFCVAGGIRTCDDARAILNAGADKISVNSPALENPELITKLSREFGTQCVVVGVDSRREDGGFFVYQYTGDEAKTVRTKRDMLSWITEAQDRGAGEIVLNCMDSDGVGGGYDIEQLSLARARLHIPLIASGGAKTSEHFYRAFTEAQVDGGLAAGAFHRRDLSIGQLKMDLQAKGIEVRL